ncbi:MAG TPA: C39 family peptidase [Polyangiales bacterium]|nr:C39 family peptidase [Polyangiales bacterium]
MVESVDRVSGGVRLRSCSALIALLAGTAACAAAGSEPQGRRSVLIERVPHVQQKRDFCGEAAAEMYLRALGHEIDQDQVFAAAAVDPALGRGAITGDLARALQRLGFETGPVWHQVSAAQADPQLNARFDELYADLARGVPSIVCMHYDDQPDTTEHFRLVLGYDAARDQVVYHEPAERSGAYRRMSRAQFLALWPLKYDSQRWTLVRMRLQPSDDPEPPPKRARSPAHYAQHVMALRDRIPESFSVAVEPPFVVVGNAGGAEVRAWAEGTVRRTVRALATMYFAKPPERTLDVFLFEDSASYQRYARELFAHTPQTPFGYYDAEHDALVMNISTGGGTLIHELVHPFMHANFPDCPAWFNEGLASLYEASRIRDGELEGLPNWRLPGLQRAIGEGWLGGVKELMATTDAQFYADDSGASYAQARYLMHYLQSRRLLRSYYRDFVANHRSDPSGYASLMRVLGRSPADMASFDRELNRYVLGLRYQ